MSIVASPTRANEAHSESAAQLKALPGPDRLLTDQALPVAELPPATQAEPATPADLADEIIEAVSGKLATQRMPGATYRLQFNSSFTFRDARALVPYLAALGVTHCYASPYLKARAGSPHG